MNDETPGEGKGWHVAKAGEFEIHLARSNDISRAIIDAMLFDAAMGDGQPFICPRCTRSMTRYTPKRVPLPPICGFCYIEIQKAARPRRDERLMMRLWNWLRRWI